MVVMEYYKLVVITTQLKVIPRVLPERVGKMLVTYLADVLPFRQVMDRKAGIVGTKGFVWFKMDKPWEMDDLKRVFRRETGTRLGLGLTTADYRHISDCDRSGACAWSDGWDGPG
jgi:hypothetical protein